MYENLIATVEVVGARSSVHLRFRVERVAIRKRPTLALA